ncbi:MAG TPA: DUF1641 domain-containing protein [Verrucomicrobiae bacterium]|jgi:uncharacterized protein YjgD (DUF1641 family)
MAASIKLEFPARDPRAELQARLQTAPLEHAEALLSAYEVLQGLHDRGVLELARGALGSRDKVLEIIVEAAKSPEAIRGMRNLLVFARLLGELDPSVVEGLVHAIPQAIAQTQARQEDPPGIWSMIKSFGKRDSRRGLLLTTSVLEAIGRNLKPKALDNPKP